MSKECLGGGPVRGGCAPCARPPRVTAADPVQTGGHKQAHTHGQWVSSKRVKAIPCGENGFLTKWYWVGWIPIRGVGGINP